MPWEQPTLEGLEGFNNFLGQITPYLLPVALILFMGGILVFIGKRVYVAVS